MRARTLGMLVIGASAVAAAGGVAACGSSTSPTTADDASAPDGASAPDAAPPLDANDASAVDASDGGVATLDGGWRLVWSDEFDGPDGGAPDPAHWTHEVGGDGWGNAELEYYTADLANAFVAGGDLVIRATKDGTAGKTCWNGACQFTSARITTKTHFAQAYGRFETRARIPGGNGLWPAFWLLGNDIAQVSWPACGEIDIMENIGKEPAINHGSLHGPVATGSSNATNLSKAYALDAGRFADGYHRFAVEWETNVVRFYVDDVLYETRTPADNPAGAPWVYDHPYFILLNLAVGGNFPGAPDNTTPLPADLHVDYVRVYSR